MKPSEKCQGLSGLAGELQARLGFNENRLFASLPVLQNVAAPNLNSPETRMLAKPPFSLRFRAALPRPSFMLMAVQEKSAQFSAHRSR